MNSFDLPRRTFMQATGATIAGACVNTLHAQQSLASGVRIVNPLGRVPLSFIIDDSTCLVNMGHFCTPQFAEAWPDRDEYKQPWKDWPREIPDDFVREFGEWCAQQGVKGKYSIVPYPACVGWLDRGLPGWSKQQLDASLGLVRDLMLPNWDIHPEMITHTRVIDLKTGRPKATASSATMENSYPQIDQSVDELASYLAYALKILKNCGLPCEGVTTPGGFGNRVKDSLPLAVHQAVRDVFPVELPHYFKYVVSGPESTAPRLEFVGASKTIDNLTVSVPAGTGDWFGGWQGIMDSEGDRYCNADATQGRMVEMIQRGEPAVMLCHWPGMYCNGQKSGFETFKRIVVSLADRYRDQTLWMKVSEIARYWAVKEMATIARPSPDRLEIETPLSCPRFTLELDAAAIKSPPVLHHKDDKRVLRQVATATQLSDNTFTQDDDALIISVDAPAGKWSLTL
ncbi:hypothetical protein K227x_55020 [Rubripirellula lacrimiformis]|uniref:Uncharacterized protein n=1 Tax=Rubripirellula lacrimiformis TaxID=1930273 RepID=A0A517NIW5_9BACT|nr:hypothetical protein [Rubripirellula lacrimiformis]QDT07077.1 hypothetical protein K227x_55020 [Rubripirellula lacrimiformis]